MRDSKPKSINSLMAFMRENKNINIDGSRDKRNLKNIGYFHGYKGYRYYQKPENLFKITNFDEIMAIYDFDMRLKAIIYPRIMFLETALKNYTLEVVMEKSKSKNFNDIYNDLLNSHKEIEKDEKKSSGIRRKLELRNAIYREISNDYGRSNIVNHYYNMDKQLPIWAIFELITLGEFGNFVGCLNKDIRMEISNRIGIRHFADTNSNLLENIIFVLKDLRNSVAHNNIIFDVRYRAKNINNNLASYIKTNFNVENVDFYTITDYVILIAMLLSYFGITKTENKAFLREFKQTEEILRKKVPFEVFSKIIHTDSNKKIKKFNDSL